MAVPTGMQTIALSGVLAPVRAANATVRAREHYLVLVDSLAVRVYEWGDADTGRIAPPPDSVSQLRVVDGLAAGAPLQVCCL